MLSIRIEGIALALVLATCVSAGSDGNTTGPEFREIGHVGQLFTRDVETVIATLGMSYGDCIWPAPAALTRRLALDTVPQDVIKRATSWVGTVVNEAHVPRALKDHWIALRMQRAYIPPQEVDYLITRFETKTYYIQVMDNGGTMSILVRPKGWLADQKDIREYVRGELGRMLRLPVRWSVECNIQLQRRELPDKRSLHYGVIEYRGEKEDEIEEWWNRLYIWTDGQAIYVGCIEWDENMRTGRQARPGIPSRFHLRETPVERVRETRTPTAGALGNTAKAQPYAPTTRAADVSDK